jgi:hypothetical protein
MGHSQTIIAGDFDRSPQPIVYEQPNMKPVLLLFDLLCSLTALSFGLFLFHSGYAETSANSMIKLPFGAAVIVAGGLAICATVRSGLQHRRLGRRASLRGTEPSS